MADFERLIRGALGSQKASSAEVRKVVYQSSRNALQKIIDNNRSLTVEAVMAQKRQLEVSIDTIEAEYTAPAPIPAPIPTPIPEAAPILTPENIAPVAATPPPAPIEVPVGTVPEPIKPITESPKVDPTDPLYEIQQILESTSPKVEPPVASAPSMQPVVAEPVVQVEQVAPAAPVVAEPLVQEPVVQVDAVGTYDPTINPENEFYQEANPDNIPLGFQKRRKSQKRLLWTIITLLILGLVGWIGYIIYMGIVDGSLIGQKKDDGPKLNPNAISRQADSENYITVIDATDLSSLVTAGNGKAEIVNQLNSNMIRINSERDAVDRSQPAKPILIRLKPGVLEQISGKRVTVEVFAKSGGSDTAHFAIGCDFGGLTACGRKRFLAGSQPNASVFAFQMDKVSDINQDMFLTLSTDTTSQASVTGKGDILDIAYIRLSVDG